MPTVSEPRASVTYLHPEHLFDKLGEGRLSPTEQRQLESHAARCATCRFELMLRDDLALEIPKQTRSRDAMRLHGVGVE